jgi:hypothetical protein
MKNKIAAAIMLLIGANYGTAQGFLNLDFESANVSGYTSGTFNSIPMNDAFLGWNGYYISSSSTNAASMASYNVLPLSTEAISIGDATPLQGLYSAFLFGANGYASEISQTGLVSNGTQSLLLDIADVTGIAGGTFTVSLGGQIINLVILQTYPNYTLYGGDVSAFAGQVVTLSIIVPPMVNPNNPNGWEFDSIRFSPSSVPEPSAFALTALGALLLTRRSRKSS